MLVFLTSVFGLIKCCILPPRKLLFPVLPAKINDKLIFTLCRSCANNKLDYCNHGDNDRMIYGTWVSEEIKKAISFDYKVIEVYEIYHFERKKKIFVDFVNNFMKIKQENSGIPKDCYDENGEVNDELLEDYIKEYYDHEGVLLTKDNIVHNESKRTVVKTILNSLWGKFAQADNTVTVSFINELYDLLELANNRTNEITSVNFITSNVLRTTHKKIETCTSIMKNRNVIIASFVTCYARLKLLDVLHQLNERVLYYDTDSIIYVSDGTNDVKTGNFLGDLTDELNKKATKTDTYITQFCSTGPKSYSYITNHNDEIVHAKGFSLKGDAKYKITFNSIKKCVENNHKIIEVNYEEKISRDNQQNVFVCKEIKKFKFTFDKRVILDNFFTIPYGY